MSDWIQHLIDDHREALRPFDPRHLNAWNHTLAADKDAAFCEAVFWRLLGHNDVTVEPNADLTGKEQRPDFRCLKNGRKFYVETTCISIEKAERKTSIPNEPTVKVQPFDVYGFNHAVVQKVAEKIPQCAAQDAPCIVAVGTFHSTAGMVYFIPPVLQWLQTGQQSVSWNVYPATGQVGQETYLTTELKSALFLFPESGQIMDARRPVSAVLIGALNFGLSRIVGFLNPAPIRPFDPSLLDIPFCGLKSGYQSGTLTTYWTQRPPWLFR